LIPKDFPDSPLPIVVPTAAPVSSCAMYDFGGATGGGVCTTPSLSPVAKPSPVAIPFPVVVPTIRPAAPVSCEMYDFGDVADEGRCPEPSPSPIRTAAPVSCEIYNFSDVTGDQSCTPTILDTAREDPDLSLAVILFERAGLTEIFSCPGPFTVQFPTNSAVELVDASVLDFLLRPENQAELMNLMLYHVLPGEFPTSTLQPGPTRTLANAGTAEVIVSQNPTMFNGATVILADISACNGLINTLDAVLTFIPTCKTKKFCNWRIPTIDCHVSHFL
jgi:uncharacterized surface protein with fasciclin (FAS1) repeats